MTEKSSQPSPKNESRIWNGNADVKTSAKRKSEIDENSNKGRSETDESLPKKLCTIERNIESKNIIDINKNIETSTEIYRFEEAETDLMTEESFSSRIKKQAENDDTDSESHTENSKIVNNVISQKIQIPVKRVSAEFPAVNHINLEEVPLWDDKENNNIHDEKTFCSSEYVKFPIRRCNIKNEAHDTKKYVEVHDKLSVVQNNSQKVFRCVDCGKIYSNILHAIYVSSSN
ncbi:unnamed protein product [Meganyctiphanes norvegica]|uniref:C2H2-type domain-containing protein n=1 Tax=Meganyctiphanes norvegica TaxID=48144 RepID=A0AAV2RZ10_MEGNR